MQRRISPLAEFVTILGVIALACLAGAGIEALMALALNPS